MKRVVFRKSSPTDEQLTHTHDLGLLWQWMKPEISQLGDHPESIRKALRAANGVFAEFQKFDANAASFRFARSQSGQPHLPDFSLINLRIFSDECAETAEFLEGVLASASNDLDSLNEMKADALNER